MCGHTAEQAEVPAAQWLSGRDFTFPPPSPNQSRGAHAHAAETIIRDPTNGVGVGACVTPSAEPKIATGVDRANGSGGAIAY
jgi:hypothetical protein